MGLRVLKTAIVTMVLPGERKNRVPSGLRAIAPLLIVRWFMAIESGSIHLTTRGGERRSETALIAQ